MNFQAVRAIYTFEMATIFQNFIAIFFITRVIYLFVLCGIWYGNWQ